MRRVVPTPLEVIIGRLPAGAAVFVLGCGGCATRERFGGAQQCRELAENLAEAGVQVAGWAAPEPGDAACDPRVARRVLTVHTDALQRAGVIVLLACPQAEPAVMQVTDLPLVAGVQTITGTTTGGGAMTVEECNLCDDCIARAAGGLCPHSFCPKQLMNGPCGGAQSGRCEVFPGRPCVWELIYRRLKADGKLKLLERYRKPMSFRVTPDE